MKKSLALSAALMMFAAAGCTQAGAADDLSRQQVEKIVKEYLMENPEIIRDALIELEEKEERVAMAAANDGIYNDDRDPTLGPDNAKITIVEFFDYNCGYCKRSTEWLQETLKKHPKDVRVIFKELPILDGRTKTSKNAAKAALAAAKQGKYKDLHFALMSERGLSHERVEKLAEKAGVDVKKLNADMDDVKIAEHIQDNIRLAGQIPTFSGTPFFIIGDDYISGANTERLNAALEAALGN